MTNQEFKKYTSEAYITKTRNLVSAIKLVLNEYNLGKSKIIMLDGNTGMYAVAPNKVANKFIAAGYEEYKVGFEAMILAGK